MSNDMSEPKKKKDIFTSEDLVNITSFGNALLRVHARLMAEGYKIVDGKLILPKDNKVYNRDIQQKNENR